MMVGLDLPEQPKPYEKAVTLRISEANKRKMQAFVDDKIERKKKEKERKSQSPLLDEISPPRKSYFQKKMEERKSIPSP